MRDYKATAKTQKKPVSNEKMDFWNGVIENNLGSLLKSNKASKVIDKDFVKSEEGSKKIPFKFDEEFCQKVLNAFPDNKEVEEALENNSINTIEYFINERLDTRSRLDLYLLKTEYLDKGLQGFKDLQEYVYKLEDNIALKDELVGIVRDKRAKEQPEENSYDKLKQSLGYYTHSYGNTTSWGNPTIVNTDSENAVSDSTTLSNMIDSIYSESASIEMINPNDNPTPITFE